MKKEFVQIPVSGCPCSVFVEKELLSITDLIILDVEKMGMYSELKLSFESAK